MFILHVYQDVGWLSCQTVFNAFFLTSAATVIALEIALTNDLEINQADLKL